MSDRAEMFTLGRELTGNINRAGILMIQTAGWEAQISQKALGAVLLDISRLGDLLLTMHQEQGERPNPEHLYGLLGPNFEDLEGEGTIDRRTPAPGDATPSPSETPPMRHVSSTGGNVSVTAGRHRYTCKTCGFAISPYRDDAHYNYDLDSDHLAAISFDHWDSPKAAERRRTFEPKVKVAGE
jgi:hypothetical protein